METKRCRRCHKLLRVDAQMCSRCGGYDFLPASSARTRYPGSLLVSDTASMPSKPDLPVRSPSQLSPHRAGHYSGLHPEDEPYQSSFLPVQRPPISAQPALEVEEVEDLTYSTLPDVSIAPATVAPPKRRVASFTPLPAPRQQRSTQTYRAPRIEQNEIERDLEATHAPVSAPTLVAPHPLALATRPPKRRRPGSVVSLLLILSCFLFVVATSILAFLLIDSRPPVALKPQLTAESVGKLEVYGTLLLYGSRFDANASVAITRDTNIPVLDAQGHPVQARTFSTGNFFASITIGQNWSVAPHVIYATDQQGHQASFRIKVQATPPGPPLLQLSLNHIDMGENSAGVVSHKTITLSNSGSPMVNWQGTSDSPAWLKLTPTSGSFAVGQQVVITVDRGSLAPQAYTGHIKFIQQDSTTPPLVLTVTMGVNPASANPASANLVLSNSAFAFTGDPVTNPVAQTLTIQNTGGQGLNWTASVATVSGGNWLTLSSGGGYLGAGAGASMTVSATSAGLGVGTYQGALTFSYAGASATPVTVTLTVNPPPVAKVAVSAGGLSFHTIMGLNPPAQSFTITNTGNAPLNWGILEDTNAKTYASVSQSSGTLAPSKSIVITVTPSISQANAGILNGTITVLDTDAATPVKSQQVKVAFSIVNQAVIGLDQYQMTFNHSSTIPINISTQLITLTNTGSAPLNWSVSISNPSPVAWLSVDNSGSTGVNPGGAEFINVTCDSTLLSPGTFQATLTIHDTDAGSPVAPQVVTVTVVVS